MCVILNTYSQFCVPITFVYISNMYKHSRMYMHAAFCLYTQYLLCVYIYMLTYIAICLFYYIYTWYTWCACGTVLCSWYTGRRHISGYEFYNVCCWITWPVGWLAGWLVVETIYTNDTREMHSSYRRASSYALVKCANSLSNHECSHDVYKHVEALPHQQQHTNWQEKKIETAEKSSSQPFSGWQWLSIKRVNDK